MDMDYESECVFWADMDKDVVNKQCLANSSRVRQKKARLTLQVLRTEEERNFNM